MPSTEELKRRIAELELENRSLRAGLFSPSHEHTVIVPPDMQQVFDVAQKTVHDYFQQVEADPSKGFIEIGGQRYVLIRASSLSIDFLDTIQKLYADRGEHEAKAIGKSLLFDISHSLGVADAKNFHQEMGLTEPVAKLSAGPVHFAYCGWALVDIKPESNPVPGDDFFLLYDHPYSFEAASWIQAGRDVDSPLCIMNAGYSSGWCEESFGIDLTAVEVSCQARGDPTCTFVMAPPSKISARLKKYFGSDREVDLGTGIHIPSYFDRKRAEETLRRQADELGRAYGKLNAAHQELKTAQVKAVQASRLASIGELAAGVAHELNSPLCVVQGYANLLAEELECDDGLEAFTKKVKRIQAASERCKVIVDDLLAFSRQTAGTRGSINLADVVKQTFNLIGVHFRQTGLKVRIEVPEQIMVWGNAGQLQQVVTNIAMNSAQAMGESGELRVCASLGTERRVVLEMGDTGPGIPAEHLDRIFDPFFTTKPTGEGTGLGLSIVYGIIKAHDGQINVDSVVGQGTTFRIELRAG